MCPITAPASNVNITSLSISGTGTLDIGNNHIIINYSGTDPIAIHRRVDCRRRYGGGTTVTWTGTGITSSDAAINPSYGIGYADAADAGNPAGLASGQIEVMYTLLGDANLDGKVNGTDFNLMAANFNQAVTDGWDKGDFNYDGKVNGSDFVLLADNFNQFASQSAVSSGRSGGIGCLRRRERHQPGERARTRVDGPADPGRGRAYWLGDGARPKPKCGGSKSSNAHAVGVGVFSNFAFVQWREYCRSIFSARREAGLRSNSKPHSRPYSP